MEKAKAGYGCIAIKKKINYEEIIPASFFSEILCDKNRTFYTELIKPIFLLYTLPALQVLCSLMLCSGDVSLQSSKEI